MPTKYSQGYRACNPNRLNSQNAASSLFYSFLWVATSLAYGIAILAAFSVLKINT